MKIVIFIVCFSLLLQKNFAQNDSALIHDVDNFQKELVKEYTDAKTSPLSNDAKKEFRGIHFFPVNMQYVVKAKFIRTPGEKIFSMPTSGKISKDYVKYGEVHFSLMNAEYKLNVYQSIELAMQRKYRDYLFIPFRDLTSGKETYGGGRYIDITIPQTDTLIINFNKAYQPYCAYTEGYNCPIPPRENYLQLKVEAGVRF